MKNKKVLTLAMVAGLAFGGLSVATVASAQGYGSDDAPAAETADTTDAADSSADRGADGAIVQVQDTTDDAEVDGETDTDGERERGRRGGCNLDTAAEAIGIEEDALEAALENGDTIADVAAANGVDVDTVIDAMVADKAERLAEKVEEGRITQDEADEKLANAEAKITDRVNGVEDAPDA